MEKINNNKTKMNRMMKMSRREKKRRVNKMKKMKRKETIISNI